MQIISGDYKNFKIKVKNKYIKPLTTKIRSAIFATLTHILKKNINHVHMLELFSGTGILSIEAMSRGIKHITLIDKNKKNLNIINNFKYKVNNTTQIKCIKMNIQHLPQAKQQFDIVFLDPPYNQQKLISITLFKLTQKQWLNQNAIIILKTIHNNLTYEHLNLKILKNKNYGETKIIFLQYKQ